MWRWLENQWFSAFERVQSNGELSKSYYTGGVAFTSRAGRLAQQGSDCVLHHAPWKVLDKPLCPVAGEVGQSSLVGTSFT